MAFLQLVVPESTSYSIKLNATYRAQLSTSPSTSPSTQPYRQAVFTLPFLGYGKSLKLNQCITGTV